MLKTLIESLLRSKFGAAAGEVASWLKKTTDKKHATPMSAQAFGTMLDNADAFAMMLENGIIPLKSASGVHPNRLPGKLLILKPDRLAHVLATPLLKNVLDGTGPWEYITAQN
jgi:hypothetical protein